ncbi:MAG: hypothetical protein ABI369_13430 [Acetobacteraceae bacterium]
MADTIGFIDGLEGAYVRGWAIAQGSGEARPAAITIRDPAGKVLARGLADLDRPDVGRLGHGSACGFRVPVRRMGRARALHVFADGVEVAGSPVPVGAGVFDGSLVLADGLASGWVMERISDFRAAPVRLHDQDGVLVG